MKNIEVAGVAGMIGLALLPFAGDITSYYLNGQPSDHVSSEVDSEASRESDPNIVRDYYDQELLDDNGNKYTLHKNADGSETARYDDGKEVTFKRDEHGNINFLSGAANLLPELLFGYLMFSGGYSPGGTWDSAGNFVATNGPLKPASQVFRSAELKKYTPAGIKIQDIVPPSQKKVINSSKKDRNLSAYGGGAAIIRSPESSVGTVKSGFGSAGARSAAS